LQAALVANGKDKARTADPPGVYLLLRVALCTASGSARRQIRKLHETLEVRILLAILLLVALPAIAKSQTQAKGHNSEGGSHQDNNASANRLLPVSGSCRSRAVAHGATLGERRRCPQAQKPENSDRPLDRSRLCAPFRKSFEGLHQRAHLPASEIIRNASGKKTIIMAKQKTSEHMVSHFMRDTSYFMCMK